MAEWLFAGGFEAVRILQGAPSFGSGGSSVDSAYADHYLNLDSGRRVACDFINASNAARPVTTGEKLSVHFALAGQTGLITTGQVVEVFDSSDQPWLALQATENNVVRLVYNSGTGASPVWTPVSATTATLSGLSNIDIWITLGAPHTAGFSVNNSLIAEGTFTQGSMPDLYSLHLRGGTGNDTYYSEIMAAVDINLVGARLKTAKPTGNGANTAWVGDYTAVDDTAYDDADSISSGTAGEKETYTYTDLPTLTASQAVGDVFLWTRARNSGGAPSNVAPIRRDSGVTDNVGGNFAGIGGAYQSFLTRYSGLSESEFNASEFGVQSAT